MLRSYCLHYAKPHGQRYATYRYTRYRCVGILFRIYIYIYVCTRIIFVPIYRYMYIEVWKVWLCRREGGYEVRGPSWCIRALLALGLAAWGVRNLGASAVWWGLAIRCLMRGFQGQVSSVRGWGHLGVQACKKKSVYVCMCIYIYIYLFIYLPIYPSIHPCSSPLVYLSLSRSLSICLAYIYIYICMYTYIHL